VAELVQNSSWGSQERQDRRLAGLPAARRRHASVVGGGAGAWWRSIAAMGGGVAWRAPAIMDGGAAGWSAETECCSCGQHLPSACRHVPINLPHQFLLHQSSLPPVPRSSRPIGRGASGRSGCSSTRPRSNGGGERRGVRLRMCGGRRRRRERVIRGVDDRLTGGRVVTKFFHLPALLSSRRVGDDGHLSSIACRLASTPEGRKIRVLVMLAGGRWGSCPTVPHGELRHWLYVLNPKDGLFTKHMSTIHC